MAVCPVKEGDFKMLVQDAVSSLLSVVVSCCVFVSEPTKHWCPMSSTFPLESKSTLNWKQNKKREQACEQAQGEWVRKNKQKKCRGKKKKSSSLQNCVQVLESIQVGIRMRQGFSQRCAQTSWKFILLTALLSKQIIHLFQTSKQKMKKEIQESGVSFIREQLALSVLWKNDLPERKTCRIFEGSNGKRMMRAPRVRGSPNSPDPSTAGKKTAVQKDPT